MRPSGALWTPRWRKKCSRINYQRPHVRELLQLLSNQPRRLHATGLVENDHCEKASVQRLNSYALSVERELPNIILVCQILGQLIHGRVQTASHFDHSDVHISHGEQKTCVERPEDANFARRPEFVAREAAMTRTHIFRTQLTDRGLQETADVEHILMQTQNWMLHPPLHEPRGCHRIVNIRSCRWVIPL